MCVIWALLEQKIKIIKIGLIWTKSTTNHCDGECWCDYWGGKIGTNLINLEFWFLVSFTRSESRPAEQAPSPPRKGLNDFRAGGDSGTAGTGRRGRLWFEALENPERTLDGLNGSYWVSVRSVWTTRSRPNWSNSFWWEVGFCDFSELVLSSGTIEGICCFLGHKI